MKKILIMGLPGSGKTTLANALAPLLGAVVFNADDIRTHINKDLGFSCADRIEQARRMGHLCDLVVASGQYAIADFVCPTIATREAFGDAVVIWMDTIKEGRFEDTNKLFERPRLCDVRIGRHRPPMVLVERMRKFLQPVFNPMRPTALLMGRYQPFHSGHIALFEEALNRVGQVCIAVRSMPKGDADPYSYEEVKHRIETSLAKHRGRFIVTQVPNITNVIYGRDVGYYVERIDLPAATEAISATDIRNIIAKS